MIKILVDSASSITPRMAQSLGVHLIPLKVAFGEESFFDGVNLDGPSFYTRLAASRTLPITSQPSAGEFLSRFQELTADGSQVLCIVISHKLSGTLSSAEAAREMLPDRSIHVFDSLSVSIGEGLMALAAAQMAQAGQPLEAILARLERMRAQMRILFVVDTLEYLQKGGRIGGAAAFLGTMLKLKPLLTIENGRIEPSEKVRTKAKAVERMLALLEAEMASDRPAWLGLAHGNCPDECAELEETARARFCCQQALKADVGPIIGTHVGPGVLGMGVVPAE
ncbi:MAG TPA: DegV family protein [Anaerolineae bacterium]|nr:DegV family protein [Anaerolineae bacterium]HOQ99880.1 DegV family protein [Anaerolineae bacterium]HPL30528.1 DegV family protein [Anaerolineae bacterium]